MIIHAAFSQHPVLRKAAGLHCLQTCAGKSGHKSLHPGTRGPGTVPAPRPRSRGLSATTDSIRTGVGEQTTLTFHVVTCDASKFVLCVHLFDKEVRHQVPAALLHFQV